ncbi:ecdysone 20-monooxygenase [Trichonephila inaurata madagascariensis]|uniref:Ecdysone 20-monooxygenase n=1 Tax=Trichonephila inaurata madagascariensis TaxID=2747483 RepID=A0A8X6XFB2_9ARAC|nr:ecdysone 20-monooxygenase [Trichonephila inaurata madagascariensis]
MSRVGDDFVDLLRSVRNPDTFAIEDMLDLSYRLALEGVYMMSLDTRLGCLDLDLGKNTAAADMILSVKLLFESFHELFYGLPLWKLYETASYKKLDKAESLMYEACSRQIREAVEKLRKSDDDEEGVLRTLIKTNKLDDKELIVSVIDLISGGIFTINAHHSMHQQDPDAGCSFVGLPYSSRDRSFLQFSRSLHASG